MYSNLDYDNLFETYEIDSKLDDLIASYGLTSKTPCKVISAIRPTELRARKAYNDDVITEQQLKVVLDYIAFKAAYTRPV